MKYIIQFKVSLVVSLIYFLFLVYPLVVIVGNPVPTELSLQMLVGKVVRASATHPNVIFLKNTGSLVALDFPSVGYAVIQGFSTPLVKNELMSELNLGCDGVVYVDRVKFLPFDKVYRIWSIHCGRVDLSYSEMVSTYRRAVNYAYIVNAVGHIFVLAFIGFVMYIDWRRKWRAFQ